jgi:hypothetical protein
VSDQRVEARRIAGMDPRRRGARDDNVVVIELPLRVDRIDAAGEQCGEQDVPQNSPLSPTVGTIGS